MRQGQGLARHSSGRLFRIAGVHNVHQAPSVEPHMNLASAASLVVFAALAASANAESLRCNGLSASEGDSKLSVLYKCGQPLLAQTFCAPVYFSQTLQLVPEPFASTFVPCQYIEEWFYDRGPGNLSATVRFRSGLVLSITYARAPQ